MNDLYRFDPGELLWTNLTWAGTDGAPPALDSFGFAAVDGRLYVFGGLITEKSGQCPDAARAHSAP
jgi:hypothetical protein